MCWMDIRRGDDALRASIEAVRAREHEHGHSWGWAAVTENGLEVERGLGEIPEGVRIPDTEAALCHTRFATVGEITVANAHPFPVEVDGETVAALAHNGTWYGAPEQDGRSDSRAMAAELEYLLGIGMDFGNAFGHLAKLTGETLAALRADGSCWVHAGRFPITRDGDVVSSSGHELLPEGVHVL